MVTPKVILHRVRRRLKGLVARVTEDDPFNLEPQPEEPSLEEYHKERLFHYVDRRSKEDRCAFDNEACPEEGCGSVCRRYLATADQQGGMETSALVYSSRMGKLRGLIRDLANHPGGGMQHQYRKGLERAYEILTGTD